MAGQVTPMSLPTCYAVTYLRLAAAAREVGYALTLHGSMARDLDIVAVPWAEDAVSAEELAALILDLSGGFLAPREACQFPRRKPHGRLCWSIHLGGGPFIDLSVMPRGATATGYPAESIAEQRCLEERAQSRTQTSHPQSSVSSDTANGEVP